MELLLRHTMNGVEAFCFANNETDSGLFGSGSGLGVGTGFARRTSWLLFSSFMMSLRSSDAALVSEDDLGKKTIALLTRSNRSK